MGVRARAMANLYRRNKITENGLKQAVADGTISVEEYEVITGNSYVP